MEPKTLATSVAAGSALVGGSVGIKSYMDDKNPGREFLTPEIGSYENIGSVLKNEGLDPVEKSDTVVLREIKGHLVKYVEAKDEGFQSELFDSIQDKSQASAITDDEIVNKCTKALDRQYGQGFGLLFHARAWCTKKVTILSLHKSSIVIDYAPLSTRGSSEWAKILEDYKDRFKNEITFDELKTQCSKWKNLEFRKESDALIMDKFTNCLLFVGY